MRPFRCSTPSRSRRTTRRAARSRWSSSSSRIDDAIEKDFFEERELQREDTWVPNFFENWSY